MYHITPAIPNDIPQLVHLINNAYRGETSKKGWTTEAYLFDETIRTDETVLNTLIKLENILLLKNTNEAGSINGCICLEKQNSKLLLSLLAVSPHFQKRGIGSELLKASDKYAQINSLLTISMTVISVRKELIIWYEQRGYQQTGEKKQFPLGSKFGTPKQLLEFVILEKSI